MNTQIPDPLRRTKWLTQALLMSGALNIGLMATFVYFVMQEKNKIIDFELQPAQVLLPVGNQELLHAFSLLPFHELLIRLEDPELVEEGFLKRDLALSCLVAFHHFDLDRALGGGDLQKRKISLLNHDGSDSLEIFLFPGLTESHYQAIIQYAAIEKWPLTSKGLFYELQKGKADHTLAETFFLTKEFEAVHLLFTRSQAPVDKNTLLNLLLEGQWNLLENFVNEQKKGQDLTANRRVAFLIDYLHLRSKIAAQLLLETDFEFVCKRLDDPHILLLLELTEQGPIVEKFSKVLLISPRSDTVWKKAAFKLSTLAGEPPIEPFHHTLALQRFIPQALKIIPPKKASPEPPKKKTYVIQEGDSLWKIAKKHRVSIDALIRLNHLKSETLRPGKELLIP